MSDCQTKSCCASIAPSEALETAVAVRTDGLVLRIDQMDCPTEEGLLRGALGRVPGVQGLDFNLMHRRLRIEHTLEDPTPIIAAVRATGMEPIVERGGPYPTAGTSVFRIENMDCPTEEALIRSKLSTLSQVAQLDFNLVQRRLSVTHTGPMTAIREALQSVGMQAVSIETDSEADTAPAQPAARKWQQAGLLLGLAAAVGAEIIAWTTGVENSLPVILLSLLAIGTTGLGVYKKGWIALKNRNLNINALMSIAVTGAVLIGQWPEAAMVMVLFAIAELIEARSLDRARNAIQGLLTLMPDRVTVRQQDGSWEEQDAAMVSIGMIARVAPGERIALDGELTAGQSAVNQAPITGESMPVQKSVGDKVFAGTVNGTGSFEYRVTAGHSNSTLSRIVRAVEDAQGSRAPTQRFVDKFSRVYTPIVFAIALGVALVPPMFGADWMPWIYKALVLLVIACPCALVISTPVTVVSGLAAAARTGILIKGGVYLEQGGKLRSIALDKTGTITQGKPVVTDVLPLAADAGRSLQLAASLATRSDHPVSAAVSGYWQGQSQRPALGQVDDFEALAGRGTKGRIDGRWYYLGNHRLVEELGICNTGAEGILAKLESEGKTAVVLCDEAAPLLVIGVADTIRETSREAIAQLHQMGIRTVMLTGDNAVTATAIARQVGIDDARGELLPEDKLKAVNQELERFGTVGMVGDGINDAPALAKANIGFAMGAAGTDTAIETADVALMDDDLRKIPQFIRLSRQASAILRQNIIAALSIKAVFLILAITGSATLWMAVFADMGASLLVVFNGLRLLRPKSQ